MQEWFGSFPTRNREFLRVSSLFRERPNDRGNSTESSRKGVCANLASGPGGIKAQLEIRLILTRKMGIITRYQVKNGHNTYHDIPSGARAISIHRCLETPF